MIQISKENRKVVSKTFFYLFIISSIIYSSVLNKIARFNIEILTTLFFISFLIFLPERKETFKKYKSLFKINLLFGVLFGGLFIYMMKNYFYNENIFHNNKEIITFCLLNLLWIILIYLYQGTGIMIIIKDLIRLCLNKNINYKLKFHLWVVGVLLCPIIFYTPYHTVHNKFKDANTLSIYATEFYDELKNVLNEPIENDHYKVTSINQIINEIKMKRFDEADLKLKAIESVIKEKKERLYSAAIALSHPDIFKEKLLDKIQLAEESKKLFANPPKGVEDIFIPKKYFLDKNSVWQKGISNNYSSLDDIEVVKQFFLDNELRYISLLQDISDKLKKEFSECSLLGNCDTIQILLESFDKMETMQRYESLHRGSLEKYEDKLKKSSSSELSQS